MVKKSKKQIPMWMEPMKLALGGSLLVALVALALMWPLITAEPKNVPLAVVGDTKVTAGMKARLEEKSKGALDVSLLTSRQDAVDKIKSRELYGAVVFNPANPEVLTASANGQLVNIMVSSLAVGFQAQLAANAPKGAATPTVMIVDEVPAYKAKFDIGALAFPLIFGSIIGAVLAIAKMNSRLQRLLFLSLYSVFVGTAVYLMLYTWLDVLPNEFMAIAGSVAMTVFATSVTITGLYSVLGVSGFGLGVAFMFLVANPMSGIALPWIFMVEPWGAFGQWLTTGAGATLLRETTYFPTSANIMNALYVLLGWTAVGLALMSVRARSGLKLHKK